jgi:hypothetical protein
MDIDCKFIMTLLLLTLFVGCASRFAGREHLAAKPLAITPEKLVSVSGSKKTYVGSIAFESATKCDEFIATLTSDQSSINTGASIVSTFLTAIGTAVTPIHTAHALSAGATITSASRDAINSNLYNKDTFAAFHSALQATYYAKLNTYIDALSTTDESQIDVSVEATKLQTIHALCSLAAAESAILATIQPPQTNGRGTAAPAAAGARAGADVESMGAAGTAPTGASATTNIRTKGAVPGERIW